MGRCFFMSIILGNVSQFLPYLNMNILRDISGNDTYSYPHTICCYLIFAPLLTLTCTKIPLWLLGIDLYTNIYYFISCHVSEGFKALYIVLRTCCSSIILM